MEPVEPVSTSRYGPAASIPQTTDTPANPGRLTAMPAQLTRNCLFHQVREQTQKPRPLDRLGQLALPLGRDRGDAARHDLAALGDEALQQLDVLVVDLGGIGSGERARLPSAEKRTARRRTAPRAAGRLAFHLRLRRFGNRALEGRLLGDRLLGDRLLGDRLLGDRVLRDRTFRCRPLDLAPLTRSLPIAAALAIVTAAAALHDNRRPLLQLVD